MRERVKVIVYVYNGGREREKGSKRASNKERERVKSVCMSVTDGEKDREGERASVCMW